MGEKQLSTDEAELYDRQIRLWGIESQEKLRSADVLLIGAQGLGTEIAKNILLAGINSLTVLDDHIVTEQDIKTNFFLHEKIAVGSKIAEEVLLRLQALNPLVKISVDTESVTAKGGDFFKQFTIVVGTKLKFESVIKIDNFCREHSVKFIYADIFGYFGYCVADFQEHDYFEDQIKLKATKKRSYDGEKKTTRVEGKLIYPPLNKVLILPNTKQDITCIKKISRPNPLFTCLLALMEFRRQHDRDPQISTQTEDIEDLKKITTQIINLYDFPSQNLKVYYNLFFGEIPPVSAVLGGIAGQEIIKAVSHKEPTINNIFLFDPETYSGKEFTVGP